MTNINPLNMNLLGVSNASKSASQNQSVEENKEKGTEIQQNSKNVSEKDIFTFMNNTAAVNMANVKNSSLLIIEKYNSPEAIARIEEMMASFEKNVVEGLGKFEEELGAVPAYNNLSEADKLALAAEYMLLE